MARFLGGKETEEGLDGTPLTLFWTIWRERNNITFDNSELSAQRMKALFLCNYWSWTNMYMANRPISLVDFLTLFGCK